MRRDNIERPRTALELNIIGSAGIGRVKGPDPDGMSLPVSVEGGDNVVERMVAYV